MNFYVDEIYFYFIYFLLTFAINLDHGKSYEDIMLGINSGFTSIMVDRSSLSYEDNIAQTKETVKMCRPLNISVEAELGHVGQGEDYSSDGSDYFTKPEEAKKFVEETGIDCLAVAIGTAHGRYHGTPHIDFDLLKQITDVVDIPLVLHGGSGTGDENLRKAVKNGIKHAYVTCFGSFKKCGYMNLVPKEDAKVGAGYGDVLQKDGPVEFLNGTGVVCQNNNDYDTHFHATMCDASGQIFGGHIVKGYTPTLTTVDLIIFEIKNIEMLRVYDEETDLTQFLPK